MLTRQQSVDGIEMTFALNHLNYFLLTNLLLEMLQASAPSRIVNVSSDSHRNASMNFQDPATPVARHRRTTGGFPQNHTEATEPTDSQS